MASAVPKKDEIDVLEEDDDFEEFDQQEWNEHDEDAVDAGMWHDGWDDDDDDDDFTAALKKELATSEGKAASNAADAAAAAMRE